MTEDGFEAFDGFAGVGESGGEVSFEALVAAEAELAAAGDGDREGGQPGGLGLEGGQGGLGALGPGGEGLPSGGREAVLKGAGRQGDEGFQAELSFWAGGVVGGDLEDEVAGLAPGGFVGGGQGVVGRAQQVEGAS